MLLLYSWDNSEMLLKFWGHGIILTGFGMLRTNCHGDILTLQTVIYCLGGQGVILTGVVQDNCLNSRNNFSKAPDSHFTCQDEPCPQGVVGQGVILTGIGKVRPTVSMILTLDSPICPSRWPISTKSRVEVKDNRRTSWQQSWSLTSWLILFWPLTGLKFRLKLEKSFCPRMDRVASWVASPKDLINFYLSTFYLLLCSCTVEIDNRSWNVEETWQIGEVKTIFAKDDYNSETHENDIAILRLLIHWKLSLSP